MKKHSSQPRASDNPPEGLETLTLGINAMGAQGDGVARVGDAPVHIPFTLAGEIVQAEVAGTKGRLIAVDASSPERVDPVCRHFGVCGGCALQHWAATPYDAWKAGLVEAALAQARVRAPLVETLKTYPISSRRRAAFTARKDEGALRLGFNAARSHDLVDIEECPILLPRLAAALPHLRSGLKGAMADRGEAKIQVTAADNGLDVTIAGPRLASSARHALESELQATDAIRASWNGEALFINGVPRVDFGGPRVSLPGGAFLQAVEACERDMAAFTVEALDAAGAGKGPVCDLFAGLGAFTFPVATRASVTAYEDNAAAVAALSAAAKESKGLKPVKAIRRDLFRSPLGFQELNAFAAAVLDPPREGAEAQARALAQSKIPAAVMLSCNPATFARDAAILVEGGFELARLAAFDQFRYSAHVEVAALFRRPRTKKGRLAPALR
ncbi:class I SAM-dependent RNA methyltransferase [Rhodomicrobium vannielii ATCC 17100]|uniref:class I SAM-dependent RNA methyltransferase n=1 Tax=Rhodomicrobium vannielii TaxID=1069 RepID=UPI00191B57E4|nr:class I SAM-dependent RNA methyltransferase [Rhodomicrobium vannielii]MBJ7533288.1 class I SAM-dependent RNA methyltransferase [Rhodomicrobium vannielii ATCC 17100]